MSTTHTPPRGHSLPSPDSQLPTPPRPRYDVGDILREYGDAFRREYVLTDDQFKVMRCLEVCRTSALGGHLETCDHCGQTRPVFNSCRNRHCPKCRRLATLEWFTARQQELLPVGYFHNVFTLPHELNPLAEANPRIIYRQLFRSVSATLLKFGADPQWGLGGRLGFTTVLHTWDQQLQYHIHLHCIIAGGALSFDGNKWLPAKEYLFPIKELSRAYRAHFLHGLRCTCRRGDLILPGGMAEPGRFDAFTEYLAGKEWVCFSREPFATPDKVLEYLSRYTHRIAISNRRLLHVENGQVTFQFRDRKDNNRIKERTITAEEFIGRFLQHVMPRGMPRMRHYGFLSNPRKRKCLPQCRALLGQAEPEKKEMPTNRVELLLELAGYDWTICPKCKEGKMIVTERWQRQKALFSPHTRVIYPKLPRPKDSS